MRHLSLIMLCWNAIFVQITIGSVTEYTNMANWQNAVGNEYTTIYFNDLPHWALVTDQYSDLGITFTDPGGNFIVQDPDFHDGWGLWSNHNDVIDISFSQPMRWVGVISSFVQYKLYSNGQLVYTSTPFLSTGTFTGLVSDQPFDFVRLYDPVGGSVYVDDLFFGPPIPAPGVIVALALAGVVPRRRRRS